MADLLAKRRLKNLLLFIPNMFVLSVRLLADSRVPATERVLVAGAIVYAIVPLDLIPDMLPFVGQIDDAYLIALSLLRLMERTDPKIVREHWKGGGDVVELVGAAAMVAAKFLPKPIRRVLTARVEAAGGKNEGLKGLPKPLLVARPEPEHPARSEQ
ncbi:MAG: YkvA family protein [Acidobacteriota bacterium]